MNIDVWRDFNSIYKNLDGNRATLKEIRMLVVLVRKYIYNLSDKQIVSLLEIPKNVISKDISLNNNVQQNGDYFAENLLNPKEGTFLGDLALDFKQNKIFTDDVVKLITYCQNEIALNKEEIDFYLRVPETILNPENSILRDEEEFRSAQSVFAQVLKNNFKNSNNNY